MAPAHIRMQTGEQLLQALSSLLEDDWTSATTAAGDGASQLVDEAFRGFGNDKLVDYYVRITQPDSADNLNLVRTVTSNTENMVDVGVPFASQIGSAFAYELHRFHPATKFTALDRARQLAFPSLYRLHIDESLYGDGYQIDFDLPTGFRQGPFLIEEEKYQTAEQRWNYLEHADGDNLDGWTVTNGSASLYRREQEDLEIPKVTEHCTRIAFSSAGSYAQSVDMPASGREVSFWSWVYSRDPGAVTLVIADGRGLDESVAHSGGGWERIAVSRTVAFDNTTDLQVRFVAARGTVVFWDRAWLSFGKDHPFETEREHDFDVLRDGTQSRIRVIGRKPRRGHQLRMTGRSTLSALGSDRLTQTTNAMELDESAAEYLITMAALEMMRSRDFNENAMDAYEVRRWEALLSSRLSELSSALNYQLPYSRGLRIR